MSDQDKTCQATPPEDLTEQLMNHSVPKTEREHHAVRLIEEKDQRIAELEKLLNTPEIHDFVKGVTIEAAHQRDKWGPTHDAGKHAHDWFAVISYLHGKQVRNYWDKDYEKYIHHIVTMAALCCNWHSHAVKLLPPEEQ